MKSKIIITCILVGFIITLFAIFNFKCPYSFKENVLYTQNDVSGYNENEKENKKKRSAEGTDRHGSLCCYGAWGINSHRLVDEGQYFHAGPWICCGLK